MTTRLKGLTVAFSKDIREDDAECIISAIKMIRGVAAVQSIESTPNDWIESQRLRQEMETKIYQAIRGETP